MHSITKLAIVVAAVAIGGIVANAQDIVKERQQLMKSRSSGGAKLGAKMLKGEIAYDGEKLAEAMNAIVELPDLFIPLLKPGTTVLDNPDSTLKEEVFAEMEDFKTRMQKYAADAKAAAAAAKAGPDAYRAAFGPLTNNCKTCHEKYSTQ